MFDNTYREMFSGEDGKTKIRPAIVKVDKDEVVKKGKSRIETVYLIRDAYDAYEDNNSDALEFHVVYNKKTKRTTGALYYDRYNIDYARQIPAKVPGPYGRDLPAHERYKCSNLSRYRVKFFPPKINNINALSKYIENRLDDDRISLDLTLIGALEIEGLKQRLRKKFKLDQNTEIFIQVSNSDDNYKRYTSDDGVVHKEFINEYFFGATSFNNRFVFFREMHYANLEFLECKPVREIRTREDFENFMEECSDTTPFVIGRPYFEEENFREGIAELLDNPELFIQEEAVIKKTDLKYKEIVIDELEGESKKLKGPVMDRLISDKLESLALQRYKYFTRRDIGFEYKCVDGLKIQHNIQGKQRISLIDRRLQFFKKQQEEQQLDNLQNAGNNMAFQDARFLD